ncbi:MAG: alpha/beta fold hydrolase [Haloarculaceae archaeon]
MTAVSLDTVDVPNGETVGYRRRPGGEIPVVLLHSNVTSSAHWDVLFDRIDGRFALYAVDMRGFGGSSYRAPIDSLADLAVDVVQFADALGLETFDLLGWSTGGAVAMVVAADHPDRVERLALVAPVPTRDYYPAYERDDDGNPTDAPVLSYEEMARHPEVRAVADAQERGDTAFMKEMWLDIAYTENRPDPERFERYAADMCTQRNYVDVEYAIAHFDVSDGRSEITGGNGKAAHIEAPTLVLRGDRDLVITEEMCRDTVADVGENAVFHALPDCGHNPMVDDPSLLVAELEGFLGGGR